MSFLKKVFGKKDDPVKTYADFWNWFQRNKDDFFSVVENKKDIEKHFFDKISPKLGELKDGFFYLTGMYDDNTVELVLTADGNTKNIAFVEELVAAAPEMNGWKFTALKPAMKLNSLGIDMHGYQFNRENLFFYSNDHPDYPDEIDITIVHNDWTEDNKSEISSGTYIFLDNFLGELDFVTHIDSLTIIGKQDADKELVPIAKLIDFLNWRQKEFIEKYQGVRHDTENDNYSILEATLESGKALIAVINTDLLNWDRKASHPWIAILKMKYDGSNNNGMPGDNDYTILNSIEEEMVEELKDFDGYLNIGRQTTNGEREIYFACKDFRRPSKVLYAAQQKYSDRFEIDYEIYKDKYWQTFERFNAR